VDAELLAYSLRDENQHLTSLRFLFNDYKCNKWWFEIAEMYRRIIFIGIIPLVSPRSTTRASFGCILAIFSVAYFREEQPYRVDFTNVIAHIAQYAILVTFYAALSIETDTLMTFGLEGYKLGLFLIFFNLTIFGLVVKLAYSRYKKEQNKKSWRMALDTKQMNIVNKVMTKVTGGGKGSFSFDMDTLSAELKGIQMKHEDDDGDQKNDNDDDDDDDDESKNEHGVTIPAVTRSFSMKNRSSENTIRQYILKPKDVVMIKRVGAGAFGEVFKGTCMGEPVAIKTMIDVTEDNVLEFRNEILLTATLRHPNIVNFVGACWDRELMCLVLEWVSKGSLRDLLEDQVTILRWVILCLD